MYRLLIILSLFSLTSCEGWDSGERWGNALQSLARTSQNWPTANANQFPQATQPQQMHMPTTYNVQHFHNQDVITGSDGTHIDCQNFSASSVCTKMP